MKEKELEHELEKKKMLKLIKKVVQETENMKQGLMNASFKQDSTTVNNQEMNNTTKRRVSSDILADDSELADLADVEAEISKIRLKSSKTKDFEDSVSSDDSLSRSGGDVDL